MGGLLFGNPHIAERPIGLERLFASEATVPLDGTVSSFEFSEFFRVGFA